MNFSPQDFLMNGAKSALGNMVGLPSGLVDAGSALYNGDKAALGRMAGSAVGGMVGGPVGGMVGGRVGRGLSTGDWQPPSAGSMAGSALGSMVGMPGIGGAIGQGLSTGDWQAPSSFARGGSARRHKRMIAAHFNPQELHELDHWQGSIQRSSKDGRRSYGHLEDILKNPHLLGAIHHHASQHRAMGGHMHEAEAQDGRHGDTEIAYIGPHMRHLLDAYAGHATRNPHDGHPEYFSLSGMMGGLRNTLGTVGRGIGNAASATGSAIYNGAKGVFGAAAPYIRDALPALGSMAGGALDKSGLVPPGVGSALGGMAGNLGSSVMNHFVPEQAPTGMAAHIGQGLGTAAQNFSQGQSARQSLGAGVGATGQAMGNTGGQFLQGAGNAFGNGASPRQTLAAGAYGVGHGMAGPAGAAIRNTAGAYGSGQGLGASMMQGARGASNALMNPDEQQYGPSYG